MNPQPLAEVTWTLAQEDQVMDPPSGDPEGGGAGGGGGGGLGIWIWILPLLLLWIFILGRGGGKQRKKQAEMLAGMTKGSKVITVGGIKGSVVEVRDDEVLVKVDESANTRLRFTRDAIRTVVTDKDKAGPGSPGKSKAQADGKDDQEKTDKK
ncbi:MAG: preprotein translocase subunit YajC [Planctomycetota bacterium]